MKSLRKRLKPRLLVVYALAIAALWLASPSPASILLGLIPTALGEGLRLWATGHLHKNDALTMTGPYAYLRHPLYLGTLLIATGFVIMAAHPVALGLYAAFLIGYFAYYMPYKNRIEGRSPDVETLDGMRIVESFDERGGGMHLLLGRAGPARAAAVVFRRRRDMGQQNGEQQHSVQQHSVQRQTSTRSRREEGSCRPGPSPSPPAGRWRSRSD